MKAKTRSPASSRTISPPRAPCKRLIACELEKAPLVNHERIHFDWRVQLWDSRKRFGRMAAVPGRKLTGNSSSQKKIPAPWRWAALIWLLIWIPIYWRTWGALNFLRLCDVAVILSCAGLWSRNRLLISSQAVSSILPDFVWALDAGWRLFLGHHLVGGTEYLFDSHYPLWIRLLTLYHLILPLVLLWALHRIGYDRHGLAVQSVIAGIIFVASRFAGPVENVNYTFTDPFFHRAWGSAPIHLAVIFLFILFVAYIPTHFVLRRLFPPPTGNEVP